ncbi:MAG: alpha/beta hydrolase [Planctomycetota bacterium]
MTVRFILMPGLGADRDLFYPQLETLGDSLRVIDTVDDASLWRQPPSMSLAAETLLRQIRPLIPTDGNYILGGMSFGGSLAIEMLRQLQKDDAYPRPCKIALIASNRTSDSISKSFRINRACGSLLPGFLIRGGLGLASKLFARRERLDTEQATRLRAMADRASIEHLLWGAKAIARWQLGDDDIKNLDVPIQQIHGQKDWVIPICPRHVTHTIADGRHLITWTHRDVIDEWLGGEQKQLDRDSQVDGPDQ